MIYTGYVNQNPFQQEEAKPAEEAAGADPSDLNACNRRLQLRSLLIKCRG